MLSECPACHGQVSDQARSCPHCGHPLSATDELSFQATAGTRRPALFLVLAGLALVLTFFTPRLFIVLPTFATLGCAAISLFRHEKARALSWTVILLSVILLLANEGFNWSKFSSIHNTFQRAEVPHVDTDIDTAYRGVAEIVRLNWWPDSSLGGKGHIKWNVTVRNISTKQINRVRVEFMTYDSRGQVLDTTSGYVGAIPPGQTGFTSDYADLYKTEARAAVRIASVDFAQ